MSSTFLSIFCTHLLIHKTHDNDGEGHLASLLVRLLVVVIGGGWWSQLRTIHDLPKIFSRQHHLRFESIKVEVLAIEFINYCKSLAFTRSHFDNSNVSSHSLNIPRGLKINQWDLDFAWNYMKFTFKGKLALVCLEAKMKPPL